MIKNIIKRILPKIIFNNLKSLYNSIYLLIKILNVYRYDLNKFIKYSSTFENNSKQKLIGKIIREYHIIEKGLTMPITRMGFGKDIIISLTNNCIKYKSLFDIKDDQLIHACSVILEYESFHIKNNYTLNDEILNCISKIKNINIIKEKCSQIEISKDDYFRKINSSFPEFSSSRSSIRNFDSKINIPLDKILNAIDISLNTPSACNRQCWRVYLYNDEQLIKQILEFQGGNRGFGHLTNTLIVIVSEIGLFAGPSERNQYYIDGGMFAMNLLYSIHYNEIGACMLNCSNTKEKDFKLREICKIRDSEVFIGMIACGIPPTTFKIATSKRYSSKNILMQLNHKDINEQN